MYDRLFLQGVPTETAAAAAVEKAAVEKAAAHHHKKGVNEPNAAAA